MIFPFHALGVGVPQVCLERDLIKAYFDRDNGHGYAYAYQYPGFNRVLQATGRVIRTETDRGIIVLIDERFTHGRYRQLYPSYWRAYQDGAPLPWLKIAALALVGHLRENHPEGTETMEAEDEPNQNS